MGFGFFLILCAGLLGVLIVELMDKKFGYLIDPIVIFVLKRYDYVIERNRLLSMNGHP